MYATVPKSRIRAEVPLNATRVRTRTITSMAFADDAIDEALRNMRLQCSRALVDAGSADKAVAARGRTRSDLFAQAAADLAGTSVVAELQRAAGEGEPNWSLAARAGGT